MDSFVYYLLILLTSFSFGYGGMKFEVLVQDWNDAVQKVKFKQQESKLTFLERFVLRLNPNVVNNISNSNDIEMLQVRKEVKINTATIGILNGMENSSM